MNTRLARRFLLSLAFSTAALFAAGPFDQAAAQTIFEFPIMPTNGSPNQITLGPDGNLWFTQFGAADEIARITPTGTISEFPLPNGSLPLGITAGPDGALWFAIANATTGKIGRIDTNGAITSFPIPTATGQPFGIVNGPDNALWFTEETGNRIGRITTAGVITEFIVPTAAGRPLGIAAGPDGALWFAENQGNKIGRITLTGTITEFTIPTVNSQPQGIATGPDGNLWFVEKAANKIGRITPTGSFTEFNITSPTSSPDFITAGPDGAMWFTEQQTNKIGRITMTGVISEFPVTTASSLPFGITAGPDGGLWFTENQGFKIGTLVPVPPAGPASLVSSILPSSRSVQVGQLATVFSSIINPGGSTLNGCRISPNTYIDGYFSYQTTNQTTNALSGTPNTSLPISAGGTQTFVIAVRAGAPFPSTNVQFTYICEGVPGVAPIVGVNTLLLTFDTNPVPDVIAVGLTPSNDGFARTGGTSGTGLFAIASDNIGLSGSLTARVRLSNASLPVTATVCQTNSSTGACLTTPSTTVTATQTTNQTATWTAFLKASGAVAADPANNRAFFEFVDTNGVVRGSTSTAITTE